MTAVSLLLACLVLGVGSLLTHGYGVLTHRLVGAPFGRWAVTAIVGMAAVVLIGGLLNLAGLAFGWMLAIVAIVGIALDIAWWIGGGFRRQWAALQAYGWVNAAVAAAIVLAILGFVAATQFPALAYNFHDDYEKYFGFPVRMLATGTLAGSPLNTLGLETLGGQAFLQGFIVAWLPIEYINGFDAVFCLALVLILAASFADSGAGWLPLGALAGVSVVVINPQYVNVSSLYSGVALIMGAIVWNAEAGLRDKGSRWSDTAPAALMIAASISIKPSYGAVMVLFVLFAAIARVLVVGRLRAGLGWVVAVGLATMLFLAPWLALYGGLYAASSLGGGQSLPDSVGELNFLSAEELPYGGSFLFYTATAVGGLILAGWPLVLWRTLDRERRWLGAGVFAGCLATAASYFVLEIVLGAGQSSYITALRYALVGVVAMTPLALAGVWRLVDGTPGRRIASRAVGLAFLAAVAADFAPSLVVRVDQALTYHHVLAFSWMADDADFLAYNKSILGSQARGATRAAQIAVPAGAPILVWSQSLFLLDFARNPIFDVQPAGLATPWAHVPTTAKYVLWEYRGFAVRTVDDYREDIASNGAFERLIAARSLNFSVTLSQARRQGRRLYDDGSVAVFELAAPLPDDWRDVTAPPE